MPALSWSMSRAELFEDGSDELMVGGVCPVDGDVVGEESVGMVAATERKNSSIYSSDFGSYWIHV